MREILFRGMLSHTKKWVEGNLIISNQGKPYIYPKDLIEQDGHHLRFDTDEAFWVIPETIGQFTGLLDKNGNKIFEGDICAINRTLKRGYSVVGNKFDNPELLTSSSKL